MAAQPFNGPRSWHLKCDGPTSVYSRSFLISSSGMPIVKEAPSLSLEVLRSFWTPIYSRTSASLRFFERLLREEQYCASVKVLADSHITAQTWSTSVALAANCRPSQRVVAVWVALSLRTFLSPQPWHNKRTGFHFWLNLNKLFMINICIWWLPIGSCPYRPSSN